MRYVVDTHALVWYLSSDPRLGGDARRILSDPSAQLVVPTIVLAEAKHISDRKRIAISFDEIMRSIATTARVTILPLDIFTVAKLPGELDIHDSLIVASALTARELFGEEVAVLTRDTAIKMAGLVPTVW